VTTSVARLLERYAQVLSVGGTALALAVLATIPSRAAALLYILLFGAGAIKGMTAVTAALALPVRFGAAPKQGGAWLSALAGTGSVVFGILYLTVWA